MNYVETLDIKGHRAEPVPNTFFKQAAGSEHLVLILPGMGYTCQMPLLYYSEKLLLSMGADVLLIEYEYSHRQDFKDAPSDERERWLVADVEAAYRAAVGQGDYKRVTVIGKSIGTIAMGHLLTDEDKLSQAQAVWLTPTLRYGEVARQIRNFSGRSLLVIGSADSHYDPDILAEIGKATGLEA